MNKPWADWRTTTTMSRLRELKALSAERLSTTRR